MTVNEWVPSEIEVAVREQLNILSVLHLQYPWAHVVNAPTQPGSEQDKTEKEGTSK